MCRWDSPLQERTSSRKLRAEHPAAHTPCWKGAFWGSRTSSGFRQLRQSEASGPKQDRQEGWQSGRTETVSGGGEFRTGKGRRRSHCGRCCPERTDPPRTPPHTDPGAGGAHPDRRCTGRRTDPSRRRRSCGRLRGQRRFKENSQTLI